MSRQQTRRDARGRRAVTASVIGLLAAPAGAASAGTCTPPVNETCDGAIVIDGNDLPWSYTGPLGCVNDVIDKPYMDVFFRFDCACTGLYTLDMCDSSGDTYLRIYTGGCGWSEGEEYAVDDDSCAGSPPNADPRITVPMEAGTTYWIELGTWRPDPPWAPPPNSPYVVNLTECTACAGDANGDFDVSFADILAIVAAWGPCPASCPEDLNGNGDVDFADILAVIANWGGCLG